MRYQQPRSSSTSSMSSRDNMGLPPRHVQSDDNPNSAQRSTLLLSIRVHPLSPDVIGMVERITASRNLAEVEGFEIHSTAIYAVRPGTTNLREPRLGLTL